MKKRLKYLDRIDEFYAPTTMPEPTTKPKPGTTPTPTKDPRPDLDPFNPPLPKISPDPKNWKMVLKKCVERFNELYAKMPDYPLTEGIKDNPGIPAYGKLKADLPAPSMQRFMQLGMEAMNTMIAIGNAEQRAFTDDELKEIALQTVRKIVEGSALEKKGVSFDKLKFDIQFVRGSEDLGAGVRKSPEEEEQEEEISLAISKRELINTLSQGFGITSQARMFDEDMSEIMDKIDSELLQNYFRLMRTSLESHKYMDLEQFKEMMKQLQQAQDFAEENDQDAPSSGGVVPAKMEVDISSGSPVIVVKAYCLIFAIQEMIKGVFEVLSFYALDKTEQELKDIYAEADNWVIEQEGFVYGPMLVEIFRKFFKEVEDTLIKKGVISEYDESMIYSVLAVLYSNLYTSDREFMDIMASIFNKDIDEDLWPVQKIADIYQSILEKRGFYGGQKEQEYGEEYPESEYEEELELPSAPAEVELEPSLDDLLDKISEFGRNSLTPKEEELLKKYSENQSMIVNFKSFLLLQESKRKF